MIQNDPDMDRFEAYADLFDPLQSDRAARRLRKPVPKHRPKKAESDIIEEIVEGTEGLEGGFDPTYRPSRYEATWLLNSLRAFYEQGLITDVLALVRGGKEASVYRCAAHPSTGREWLAAKVYRPRKFRNLRNDKVYREGRAVLKSDGTPVKGTDDRILRALGKKTAFGVQVAHTSWLMYEYTTLERLYRAGAAVPQPFAANDNAILMDYLGDEHMPAPALSEVRLSRRQAVPLYREVMRNIELMLAHGLIHGDLSAYNLLYWKGRVTLIDFPQVIHSASNPRAKAILQRDIRRTCEYFARQGVESDAEAILERLWERYGVPELLVPEVESVSLY